MAKTWAGGAHIEVEGLRELQASIKQQLGKLPKEIGEAHKDVGNFVIGKIPEGDPHAVGAGTGARVRPSATKRDVLLRVGHTNRQAAWYQWGKQRVNPPAPGRPFIVGTIEKHQDEIEDYFLDATLKALDPAFFSSGKT